MNVGLFLGLILGDANSRSVWAWLGTTLGSSLGAALGMFVLAQFRPEWLLRFTREYRRHPKSILEIQHMLALMDELKKRGVDTEETIAAIKASTLAIAQRLNTVLSEEDLTKTPPPGPSQTETDSLNARLKASEERYAELAAQNPELAKAIDEVFAARFHSGAKS